MAAAVKQGKHYAPLVLMPNTPLKLFEIGNIFIKTSEKLSLAISGMLDELDKELGVAPVIKDGISEYDLSAIDLETYGETYVPERYSLSSFKPFSIYPFVLRDIAVWVPEGVEAGMIYHTVVENAGELLYRIDLFDTFTKEGKTSYAYRLVFQSMDKTLSDDEVNGYMSSVTEALNAKAGWKVR
jgi:phenylalanyl-tRNA synthetase beta subunit